MTRSTTGAGLLLALTSAATFGTAGSFAGSLLDAGWTPGAAVIVRVSLAAAALTLPALLALRGYRRIHQGDLKMLGAFGVAGVAGAQLAYFQAVQHLSVAVALLLEYSGVLLVVGWLWLRHGQRPGGLTFAGAGLAIGGLALVLDLFGAQELSLVGVLWGLGAAVGLARVAGDCGLRADPGGELLRAGRAAGRLGGRQRGERRAHRAQCRLPRRALSVLHLW